VSQSGDHHSSSGNYVDNKQHSEVEPQRSPEFQAAVGGAGPCAERFRIETRGKRGIAGVQLAVLKAEERG